MALLVLYYNWRKREGGQNKKLETNSLVNFIVKILWCMTKVNVTVDDNWTCTFELWQYVCCVFVIFSNNKYTSF